MRNYFELLVDSYPDKAEMFDWIKVSLDNHVLYFGQNYKRPYESLPFSLSLRLKMSRLYHRYRTPHLNYYEAVVSNAYFNVGEKLKDQGVKSMLPPWETGALSADGLKTIQCLSDSDFNYLISDDYKKRIYALKEELRSFFIKNKTPFLLLSNDMAPMHRVAIDVCKEVGVPSGVFLHGLPGRYNSIDDSRADCLFVWGDRIRDNYIKAGSKAQIIVTGHPNFSALKKEKNISNDILVLTRPNNNAPSSSDKYDVEDRGICLQFIYSVENVLKKLGYHKAKLRLHPSENPKWYSKYMDKDFYYIDNDNLRTSILKSEMVLGSVSTVMIDTVLKGIPYYIYNISKEINPKAPDLVPPFNEQSNLPVATSRCELESNIINKRCVKAQDLEGYIAPTFDVMKIIHIFSNQKSRKR